MEKAPDLSVVWLRALLVATLVVFLGVAGHVSAAGLLPAPGWLVAMLVVTVLLCVPLVRRRVGPVRMAGALVGGQAAVHLCLTMTAGHVGDPARRLPHVPAPGQARLPTVDGRRVGSLLEAYQSSPGVSARQTPTLPLHHLVADLSCHAPMATAHLVAAALVGVWLARGEKALWTLFALLGRRLVLARDLVVPLPPALRRAAARRRRRETAPGPGWLVPPNARRGPPALV
jgi:hypothetical protein